MNTKQPNFPVNFKSLPDISGRRNGRAHPSGRLSVNVDADKLPAELLLLRLQEMEERNTCLEKLIGQHTKQLTKVVETNAKFISIIAHDLRSPFHSILGALELVKMKLEDYRIASVESYINMASNSAIKTLNLLDNLLTWTISQHGDKSFNPVNINIYEVIAEEITYISTAAELKLQTLDQSIAPGLIVVADIQMVKIIVRNLLNNAVKFTNPGGNITVSASDQGKFVKIQVSDTGIGISKEIRKTLFKTGKFQSTAGTHNEKGTGLGLLLCKEFVETQGGKIRIQSQPGKGSKFNFTLPRSC
jgi:two-component system sensor histidine kinase/response regulator